MSLWTMVDPSIDDAKARADAVSSSVVIDDDDDAQGVMVSVLQYQHYEFIVSVVTVLSYSQSAHCIVVSCDSSSSPTVRL
jgi:hypothetical protein